MGASGSAGAVGGRIRQLHSQATPPRVVGRVRDTPARTTDLGADRRRLRKDIGHVE
jgi:hypothetical protein